MSMGTEAQQPTANAGKDITLSCNRESNAARERGSVHQVQIDNSRYFFMNG